MLTDYEGRDVAQSTIRITNAGDGLSEALSVEPSEYHLGERVYVVLATECVRVAHEDIRDTGMLRRVHTLRAGMGTVVEEALVKAVLDEQRQAIEQAKGVERLPIDGDGDQ